MLMNDLIIRACKKQDVERTPIWVMRQAGRYLPEYRAIRKKVSFLELCKTPELAAEVTIQPVDIIGVDAAIIFSDILVVPEAMGMELNIEEGTGPVFSHPIRNVADSEKLLRIDPSVKLKYVLDAIALTKKELNGRVPIIGFAGSPFTLLTYMVEGKTSKSFSNIKRFIFQQSKTAHKILELMADNIIDYLLAKIQSGADLVQIFDTWGGILSPHHFEEFSLQYMSKIVEGLKLKTDVPVILFSKGIGSSIEKLTQTNTDVIGLDWSIDIKEAIGKVGGKAALQGNLDPTILYASEEVIAKEADRILTAVGKNNGHIFNLGHGIHPDTDPAKLKFLVDYVKEKSKR
ncbi:MAG: uroporphyrinogen decarboxylase [Bacteroidetes bacterium]|nr:uroporphyrinogen decarboxylase [Bacteroidota bacterium]MBU2585635.1 uroporphyrinogen decarboxylase [Bacteroidota bacterium]